MHGLAVFKFQEAWGSSGPCGTAIGLSIHLTLILTFILMPSHLSAQCHCAHIKYCRRPKPIQQGFKDVKFRNELVPLAHLLVGRAPDACRLRWVAIPEQRGRQACLLLRDHRRSNLGSCLPRALPASSTCSIGAQHVLRSKSLGILSQRERQEPAGAQEALLTSIAVASKV